MTTPRILLVEDDEVMATIIEDALSGCGYLVQVRADGEAAWKLLENDAGFDAILTDRSLPGLDGLELLRLIKASEVLGQIPVIMETGASDVDSVQEGIAAGAHYYLTKPFKPELLIAVVAAAVAQYAEYRQLQKRVTLAERRADQPFVMLASGVFRYRTLDEARALANVFARACPRPEIISVGLLELLINAVEHGNLGIGYAEKTALMMNYGWLDEVERRLALAEYSDRHVEVLFERRNSEVRFTIRDQGAGFDWHAFLDFDPLRAFDPHGRGIAMASKFSLDNVEYQGNGNTVVATVKRD